MFEPIPTPEPFEIRKYFFGQLLLALAPLTSVYESSATPTAPDRPFVIVRFSGQLPIFTGRGYKQNCMVWVHDDPGSYLQIASYLQTLRDWFLTHGNDGQFFEGRWIEDGEDLSDDVRNTICKYSRYDLIHT